MWSSSSCVLSITRLLEHFDNENAHKVKQLLMKELECTNETQLLCKILPLLSQSITNESWVRLKRETIQLAEQQPSKNNVNKSICKEMQERYKDRLSNLHSDIISR